MSGKDPRRKIDIKGFEEPKKGKKRPEFQNLSYPSNLGNNYVYPDHVMFTIIERPGASLKSFKGDINNKIGQEIRKGLNGEDATKLNEIVTKNNGSPIKAIIDIATAGIDADAATAKTAADNKTVATDSPSETVRNLGLVARGLGNAFVSSRRPFSDKNGKSSPVRQVGNIMLPMPENLAFAEQTEWQGTDLGAIGGLAKNGTENMDGVKQAGFSQLGTIISGGAGALVSSVLGGGVLGGALVGALGGGNVLQGTLETQFRIKSNPFKEQTFQGVPFRPFDFSWTFAPTSEDETIKIKNIIDTFREYTKPSYKDASKFQFIYPHEVEIQFLTRVNGKNVTNEYLPCLKPCICKSINTNFATSGWHSFKDGAPTSITLQMQFEEIEIITAEDVKEGF